MRPAKPVAIEERIAPIYPESRPVDCRMNMLTSPPAQPYDVFVHIVSYGNEIDGLESMNALIRDKACEVGADAVVLLPPQEVAHMNMEDSFPDWVQQQKQGPVWALRPIRRPEIFIGPARLRGRIQKRRDHTLTRKRIHLLFIPACSLYGLCRR